MRKRFAAIFGCILLVAGIFCGCNSQQNSNDPSGEKREVNPYRDLNLSDYVILGEYRDFSVSVEKKELTEEMLEERLKNYAASVATVEEADHEDIRVGDSVTVDFKGYVDGQELEDASATDAEIVVGYTALIDGFSDGMIGHRVNDTFSLNLRFPEDYQSGEMAYLNGKEVRFDLTIKDIRTAVIPSDSEVAKEMGYDSEEEYVNALREQYESALENQYLSALQKAALDHIAEKCVKLTLPEDIYNQYYENLRTTYTAYAEAFNAYRKTDYTWEEYFRRSVGTTPEGYCRNQVRTELLLLAIAERENLVVPDDYYESRLKETAESYSSAYAQTVTAEDLENSLGKEYLLYQFRFDYTQDWIQKTVTNS